MVFFIVYLVLFCKVLKGWFCKYCILRTHCVDRNVVGIRSYVNSTCLTELQNVTVWTYPNNCVSSIKKKKKKFNDWHSSTGCIQMASGRLLIVYWFCFKWMKVLDLACSPLIIYIYTCTTAALTSNWALDSIYYSLLGSCLSKQNWHTGDLTSTKL